jgi:hypothetical protein
MDEWKDGRVDGQADGPIFVTVHNSFHHCDGCCRLSEEGGRNTDGSLYRHYCQIGRSSSVDCAFTGWPDTD